MIQFKAKSDSVSLKVDNEKSVSMKVEATTVINGVRYEGDYEVTPTTERQVLPTKNKSMVDDMTIHPIPIYEVSNTSGGNTVYIAGEIEME